MLKIKLPLTFLFSIFLLVSCSNDELIDEKENELNSNRATNNVVVIDPELTNTMNGEYNVIGRGYDVTQYYADNRSVKQSVINVQAIIDNNLNLLSTTPLQSGTYRSEYSENSVGLSQKLSTKAGLDSLKLFKGTVSVSANYENSSSFSFNAKKILFNLGVKHSRKTIDFNIIDTSELFPYLDPLFLSRINTATPQQLVQLYGSHVLAAIEVGGVIEVHFSGETKNEDREESAKRALNVSATKLFNFSIDDEYATTTTFSSTNNQLRYQFRGGNIGISPLNTVSVDGTVSPINVSSWASGLADESNYVLIDFPKTSSKPLIPIYEFISDPVKKAAVKNYVDQYLSNNYVNQFHTPDPVQVYYNQSLVNHFYTVDSWEAPYGYDNHGSWFKTFAYNVDGSVPIYRYLYSDGNTGNHFYVHTQGSFPGYTQEGIAFYAFLTQKPNTIPIYRYFNPQLVNHVYAPNHINEPGYNYEGIAFYAYPN